MRSRSALLPLAIIAGLAGAAPATAATSSGPVARAAGGDAPPIIPSLIQSRITRTEKALERLNKYADNEEPVKITKVSKVIRRQTTAAWRGARYYLRNPPVVVAEDAALRPRTLKQDDAAAPLVADQYAAAVAVFGLVHDVSATSIELLDGARGDSLTAVGKTMFWTLNKRDAMIEDAHTYDLPPAAEEASFRPRSLKQEDGPAGFGPLMPIVTGQLDDEKQHIAGLQSDATDLRPRGTSMLIRANSQIQRSEAKINLYWPPAADEG
jgi:hypothetical protein